MRLLYHAATHLGANSQVKYFANGTWGGLLTLRGQLFQVLYPC
jgi:hypothetical protein